MPDDQEKIEIGGEEIRWEDLPEEIKFIARRHSTMIREVLTVVEAAIPPEGKQFRAVKRMLNDAMYDARNDYFAYFYKHTGTN
jgi:hypothetical protein